jgi:hypothetical protein
MTDKKIKSLFHSYEMYINKDQQIVIRGINNKTKMFVGIFHLQEVRELVNP